MCMHWRSTEPVRQTDTTDTVIALHADNTQGVVRGHLRHRLEPDVAGRVPSDPGRCFRFDDPRKPGVAHFDLSPGETWNFARPVVDDRTRRPGRRTNSRGYISDNYQWGWIFLINVPVGFVCAGLLVWTLARQPSGVPDMKLARPLVDRPSS
jgi:hypothetical protein